ncbi:putative bifunctional diguanylate cyclase/phosphodiesterase [Stackebrandtia endophytica]|uniref:putative bifunctional diguanylate cyclase/phosphodiesterase n=1 Tax=Stackebrandtia endophytica TaxID=1496996 RepID=UPI00147715B4|nr:bifunctional diguanylate cyclase/phosphodiesterase [Stackebrandtia endophytica]
MATFVDAWLVALRGTVYVPITPAEQRELLTGLTGRMAETLAAESFDAVAGYQIGVDLVEHEFASPETLGRTITVMRTHLSTLVPDLVESRLTALIEALTTGFAVAMNDRSLDGQESVRLAALSARDRAERALRESEARFRHFATHDQLTGLPNRTRFVERLAEVAQDDVPLAVCSIDVDRFRTINDSLGHDIGDQVLTIAAGRLSRMAEAYSGVDCEVFRLDRDEFAVLLVGIRTPEEAGKLADLALSLLAEPFPVDDGELPVTASAGVMETITTKVETGEMLRSAEIALHWAKADGQGRWRVFEPTRSAADAARYRLSAAMPTALRRGEFTLAFQPLVNLTDGRLAGVEALARWNHPTSGVLPAGKFIGLAEDTGFVVAMDDYLLEQACRQAERWIHMSSEAPYIGVNLAARQLHRTGLVGYVAQVLTSTGLPPQNLQLEITEHAVIGTDEQAVDTLTQLAKLGVRIAIDDFGTGYSNLACLGGLPLHALKLDGAFARNETGRPTAVDREFVATLVKVGHTLDLQVIAEGIETLRQARRMRDAGCDLGQGWLFGAAGRIEDIDHQIQQGRSSLLGPASRPDAYHPEPHPVG